ncbi:tetratricopeptide repeat protein [Actinacidiphila bryophytorum]|uniref:TPR repeat n=2 Tax=Actinacidiphila bryophytorum TaxID=1436133 RepID=A0A9W4H3Q3_9ACTN|nr:hypothetical protein [Actinacidiphila bryophytorum]MBM9439895.1 hypothetical protein [Actinacidiphila bryophytorum]CAG7648434.1 TPR repeat [Actinacidiphila bryophytorum]
MHQHFHTPAGAGPAARVLPRPVGQWTALQAGVHPAVPGDGGGGSRFVLPAHVVRAHDRVLRERLAQAADSGRPALALVRGGACTGKTRSAWEAVRACLADWHLAFPKTAEELLDLLASGAALGPRTVLWLDEAQIHLGGPGGEDAAAALRTRLEQREPLVVVATLWPSIHRELTTRPAPGRPDTHAQARALLAPWPAVDVPAAFSADDLARMRTLAGPGGDPALRVAERTSPDGAVAQTLAAGPQLVDHYEHAEEPPGCYGRALITAAMDARRLGWESPLPAAFLRDAAPGYLTERQRMQASPDWFDQAMVHARTTIKDVVRALDDVPHPTGMGALPGHHRLADYLAHHGRATRVFDVPPASFWDAVLHHPPTPGELAVLARNAVDRGRLQVAATLAELAVAAGDTSCLLELADLHERRGDLAAALPLTERAVATDGTYALARLVRLHDQLGEHEAADRLLPAPGTPGRAAVAIALAWSREESGDEEGAARLMDVAGEGDSVVIPVMEALIHLTGGHVRRGEEELRRVLLLHDERLDADLRTDWLPLFALDDGDVGTIEEFQRVAQYEDFPVLRIVLLSLLNGREDRAELEMLHRRAAEAGNPYAVVQLMHLRWEAGDRSEAERLGREALAAGNPRALVELALQREDAGLPSEAEELARRAAGEGLPHALTELGRSRKKAGDLLGARRLFELALDAGDRYALGDLAPLLPAPPARHLGRVVEVPPAPRRLARTLAALSESSE